MFSKHLRTCLTSVAIKEMHISTTMSYCFPATERAVIKAIDTNRFSEDMKKCNVNWCKHFAKQYF